MIASEDINDLPKRDNIGIEYKLMRNVRSSREQIANDLKHSGA